MADILIPFFNRHAVLLRCLRSLRDAVGDRNRILLVDDGSGRRERAAVDAFLGTFGRPVDVVTHARNRGYKEAICTGFRAGSEPEVILLNSDTVVTPDFDLLLLAGLRAQPRMGAVAPVSNHPTDLFQYREALADLTVPAGAHSFGELLRRFERLRGSRGANLTAAPYLTGMCLALERRVFERVGMFDGAYEHGYFEDLALSCELRRRGYRLAVREDCFVYHQGHATYRHKTPRSKREIIFHNFDVFTAQWGHLPEHADLCRRMDYAGEVAPL
jgi:GT2 family glycosyltransferase